MLNPDRMRATLASTLLGLTIACAPGSESPTAEVLVLTGQGGEAFMHGEGWTVELTSCRAAIEDLRFTTGGEFHERSWVGALRRAVIGDAWAHPGHSAGGEVIGELPGRRIVDWCGTPGMELGSAELTYGDYNGADFVFVRAEEGDGLEADDPLLGYSLEVAGEAQRGDVVVGFYARIRQDEGREVIGVPMALTVDDASVPTLELQLLGERLLDGIDFAGPWAVEGETHEFVADDENYNRLLRAAQSHETYAIESTD
jgi:hypothetical protein